MSSVSTRASRVFPSFFSDDFPTIMQEVFCMKYAHLLITRHHNLCDLKLI